MDDLTRELSEAQTAEPLDSTAEAAAPAASAVGDEFASGTTIAGRYRVLGRLGRGAMGEVYEVEDLELRTPVALKLLRAQPFGAAEALARLKRELLLSRRVTHPNVCRVFDFGTHATAAGELRPFLTLELVRGRTLAEQLRAEGAMSEAEALPLVRQIAEALDAAHAVGIVHRDFKSANVLLEEGPAGIRAVVTDFGLARAAERSAGAEATQLTATGGLLGTPAYMAPEQVEGRAAGPAADLYALGVVLFEMLTGSLPFVGESPMSAAMRRLREPPPAPRALRPGLEPRWEAAVLRLLAIDPGERFATASDLVRALDGEQVTPGPAARRRRWRRAGAAAVAVAALAALWFGFERLRSAAPFATVRPRAAVAVLGFRNATAQPGAAWLSSALAEMLTTELAAGGRLRTIPGENVARMRLELGLTEVDSLAAETLARVREHSGAEVVVLGSYSLLGANSEAPLRLDLRVQRPQRTEVVALVVEGNQAGLFDLVHRAGARLREELGLEPLDARQNRELAASLPRSPQAARLYAEGLAALHRFEEGSARELLERAIEADREFAPARAALARAFARLGFEERAAAEARRALEQASNLTRAEALWIQAEAQATANQWREAAATYDLLWRFHPDDLEYGLRLAEAQAALSEPQRALETVAALRRLPPPAGLDPRVELAAAVAYAAAGDSQARLAAALAAARRAEALGARLLLAAAHIEEGQAQRRLGDKPSARRAFTAARELRLQAGNRIGATELLLPLASLMRQEGDLGGALDLYRQALTAFEGAGSPVRAARARFNLALTLAQSGEVDEAERLYEQALEVFRANEDTQSWIATLANLGTMRYLKGDLARARSLQEEALTVARQRGNRERQRTALLNLAAIDLDAGRLTESRAATEEALRLAEQAGDRSSWASALWSRCELATIAADFAAARTDCAAALDLFAELQEAAETEGTRRSLAEVALAQGALEEAESTSRAALTALDESGFAGDAANAAATLARVLVERRRLDEARLLLDRAEALAKQSDEMRPLAAVSAARARWAQAAGRPEEAVARWQRLAQQGRTLGMVGRRLEAELGAAAARRASGGGPGELEALIAEASASGYLALAAEARRLASAPGGPR